MHSTEPFDAQHIIDPQQLAIELKKSGRLIIDLCSPQSYASGHVPGAVHVSPQRMMAGTQPAPGKLADTAKLATLFGDLGLTPETEVIVYDDEGGGWAGRFIWTLDMIGHNNYRYLDGGLVAWKADGLPLEKSINTPHACHYDVQLQPGHRATVDDILAELDAGAVTIWDARSHAEYTGDRVLAAKGGCIPGAVHCEWTWLMDAQRGMRIRQDARDYLARRGITADKPVITHCQTHHRSGFTYLVGRLLGFTIRAYDGSWSEWGNHPDTPVE